MTLVANTLGRDEEEKRGTRETHALIRPTYIQPSVYVWSVKQMLCKPHTAHYCYCTTLPKTGFRVKVFLDIYLKLPGAFTDFDGYYMMVMCCNITILGHLQLACMKFKL